MPSDHYVAKFDRIGRRRDVPDLPVIGDAQEISEQVYLYALRFLGSRDVEVTVDLECMKISINWDRFGTGTLEAASDG